jgi:predicted nucleic acid-binding protein
VSVWYLDSSAIVKFAVVEEESDALTAWRGHLDAEDVLMTCELAVTEVLRAVRRVGGDDEIALAHLDSLEQLVVDRDLLLAAGRLEPVGLRTLDALHLTAAAAAGEDLAGVVTYDDRMGRRRWFARAHPGGAGAMNHGGGRAIGVP